MMLSLGSLSLALSRGQASGWRSPEVLGLLSAAAVAGADFLWREQRTEAPLFALRFFCRPGFLAVVAGTFISGLTMFGLIYYFNQFAQAPEGLNYSA